MNIIHVILLIGIWISTIVNGNSYLKQRDDFIKSGEKEQPKSLKKARSSFISSALCAIIYTIIKLA